MKIDLNESLRYLGYKNQHIDDKMLNTIEEVRNELKDCIKFKSIYELFDIEIVEQGIKLKNYDYILKGNDIKKHLKDSSLCAIMAVTLGIEVDNKIRYYEKVNMTKALIMDACATTAIEELCDEVENTIKKDAEAMHKTITWRFSPGYGDLSLEYQDYILRLLECNKKLGLSVNENHILIPRKSVTAIIGFQDNAAKKVQNNCDVCINSNNCNFRKGGKYCDF